MPPRPLSFLQQGFAQIEPDGGGPPKYALLQAQGVFFCFFFGRGFRVQGLGLGVLQIEPHSIG